MGEDGLAPRSNPDLLGHEPAERALLAAFHSGRLHHAWLIGGAPGIGKATLAFRFARFVLAQPEHTGADLFGERPAADTLRVDPSHPVFRRVAAGGHADLLTVERQFDERRGRLKGEIAVDDVRRIAPFLRLTAAEGGWRVVVVDGADRMNAGGQNAILKILEEPPARALLLLVADNPGNLLPTLRSRCRKLMLKPLDEAVVTELLGRHRPDLPETDRVALARLAEGSIGRALDLAGAGGLDLYRELVALLDTLPRLDLAAVHALGERLGRAGADGAYVATTELLAWWLARLARAEARGEMPAEVVAGEARLLARLVDPDRAAASGLDRWVEVWEKVSRLFAQAESANLDRKQAVLSAFQTIERAVAA